jgi:peptidyl-prolyl cis-trans isomerase D
MFFDNVRNNKRIVQIFLGLITLPFAFWGIDSYVRNTGAGTDLAKVGDSKISMQQFEQAWRSQQDRLRQALGDKFRPEALNTLEAKLTVLNGLVDQRLLLLEAAKGGLGTSDQQLRAFIAKIPALQENGQFSLARYQTALAGQGMSQAQFEAQLRPDLTLQQLAGAISDTSMVGNSGAEAMLRIELEERQVAAARISSEQFTTQVKIDPVAVQKYYQDNAKRFEIAEQVKAEYLVLSQDSLRDQVNVSDADVVAWYESHKDRYRQAEERRASHILIVAGGGEAEKEKAKAKAEKVFKEVQQTPTKFSELAKQYSEDQGSAQKGGDLGYFGRGMMVKPFEEAVLKLRENEISGLVQSEFGYHIIKLTGIKGGKERTLAEVRPEISDELKRQAASRQFAEAAEAFSNMVYEQPDSLQPVADRFKLKIQQSAWLPRSPAPEVVATLGPLGNSKILKSLFSDDAIKGKRNAEAVEIAPNTLIAARIVDYKPASNRSFDSVKLEIESLLRAQEASALARKFGEAKLHELQQGMDNNLAWEASKTLSRRDERAWPPGAVKAIFRTATQKLPAYVGIEADGGYMLYKIVKVNNLAEKADGNQRKTMQHEYGRILGQEDFGAYLAALRLRYKVDINAAMLTSKER